MEGIDPQEGHRIAVIGDVHGHVHQLEAMLRTLGADPATGVLPEDLEIVQVGDLIHRGPASSQVLHLVQLFLANSPGRWHQLIGNHEAQYLFTEMFHWDDKLPVEDVELLNQWAELDQIRTAAAVVTDKGTQVLITHAGVTHDLWSTILREPRSAQEAAARLNAGPSHDVPWVWQPGEMLTGEPVRRVGPLWASSEELYQSWLLAELRDVAAPFNQVHGHSTPWVWNQGTSRLHAAGLQERLQVHTEHFHTSIRLAGASLVGVDPNHGMRPAAVWTPLLLRGRVVDSQPVTPPAMQWLV